MKAYDPGAEMHNIYTDSASKHDGTKTVPAIHEPAGREPVQVSPTADGQSSIRPSPEPGLNNVQVIIRMFFIMELHDKL